MSGNPPQHSYPSGFYAPPNVLPPPPPGSRTMLHHHHHQQLQPQPSYLYSSGQNAPRGARNTRYHNQQQQQQQSTQPSHQRQRFQQQRPPPKQNNKQPSAVLQEVEKLFHICRPCHNRQFDSAAALHEHVRRQHTPCPQCDFAASPRIVQAHCAVVHNNSGSNNDGDAFKTVMVAVRGCRVQRFRICVGNRPEDIERWIAERRKRFPRQKQQQQRAVETTATTTTKLAAANEAPGLSNLLEGYGSSSSSSDDGDDSVNGNNDETRSSNHDVKVAPLNVDERKKSGIDQSATATTSTDGAQPPRPYRTRPCRFFSRSGRCRNGDNCNFSHEPPSRRPNHDDETRRNTNNNKRQKTSNNCKPSSRPASLLGKLLANDVQRETTLTLQLLEYIAENGFLQEESESAKRNLSRDE